MKGTIRSITMDRNPARQQLQRDIDDFRTQAGYYAAPVPSGEIS